MEKYEEKIPNKEQEEPEKSIYDYLMEIKHNDQDRYSSIKAILLDLGHSNTASIPKLQLDAFLIKVTNEVFKNDSLHRDVALMSLGLLKGFEWDKYAHKVRQKRFLKMTFYLERNSKSKIEDFDIADKDEKELATSALSKVERDQLSKISIYLSTKKVELDKKGPSNSEYFKKYVNNIDYLTKRDNDGKILSIKYPEPTYLKPPKEPADYIPQIFIELKKINNRTNFIHDILEKLKTPAAKNTLTCIAFCVVFLGGLAGYSSRFFSFSADDQSASINTEGLQDEKDFLNKNNLDEFADASNTERHHIIIAQGIQTISGNDFNNSPK